MNRGSPQLTRVRENQLKVEGWEETNKTKQNEMKLEEHEGSSGGTKSVIPWKRWVSVWEMQGPATKSENDVETRRRKGKSEESRGCTVPRMSCGHDWDTRYFSLWDLVTSVWLLRPEQHDKIEQRDSLSLNFLICEIKLCLSYLAVRIKKGYCFQLLHFTRFPSLWFLRNGRIWVMEGWKPFLPF